MTNTLLTASMVVRETLVRLENSLQAAKRVRRDWSKYYGNSNKLTGVKIGDTLTLRKPNRFTVRTNTTLAAQTITEPSFQVKIDKVAGVDFSFSMQELTLSIEEYADRYIDPAVATIKNKMDYDVLQLFKSVPSQLGTPRTPPSTYAALAGVRRRLNDNGAPMEGRTLIVDPSAEVSLSNAFVAQFNPSPAISDMFEDGQLARIAGLDIFMDQNVGQQVTGSNSNSTPLANLASTTGFRAFVEGDTLISVDGLSAATATVKKGDTFTIDGVYNVNPQSRQSTGVLKQFVVTADGVGASSRFDVSSSPAYLNFYPPIYSSGAYQTVNAAPADNAAITFFDPSAGTSLQNLAFCKDAFALVSVPQEMPRGVHFAAHETWEGISLSIIQDYQISDHTMPCRIDVIYGVAAPYPELAVRLAG